MVTFTSLLALLVLVLAQTTIILKMSLLLRQRNRTIAHLSEKVFK